jgi:dolichyl-phosphate beta-glucosyltransferase
MSLRSLKKQIHPFMRYCVIGTLVTLIDLLAVYILREFAHTRLLWAVFWAFVLANTVSFFLNKYWTFKNYGVNLVRQYTKFLIVSVIGLVLTIFMMWLLAEQLRLFSAWTPRYYLICKGITSGIVMLWNFLNNKLWTFSQEVRLSPSLNFTAAYPCFLSVIIPAYNEQSRVVPTLRAVKEYLLSRNLSHEILIVDDGSRDCTSEVSRAFFDEQDHGRVLRNPANYGKGFAVKTGIQNAAGEYILFTDADNSTPIEEFDKFLPLLSPRRILIGSRYVEPNLVERRQPWYRILISRAANLIIRLFVVEAVKDTQCGFKAFHHEIGEVLSRLQRINRFAFDIEFLSLAQLAGVEIKEIPVRWLNSAGSRIRPIRDTLRTFGDLILIKIYIWSRAYARSVKRVNRWNKLSHALPANGNAEAVTT